MSDLSRVLTRWLIFSLLLGLPLLRMLLRDDYGLINPEALVAVGLMAALALIPAAITRNRWTMYGVTVVIIVVMSAHAIKNDFVPNLRFGGILAGLFVGVGAAVVLLRDNFYKILLIFLAGTFLVDIGNSVTKRFAQPPSGLAATGVKHNHVVHIIFDEMLGLGAMPPECVSCAVARDQIEETLRRWNFRIYPYAFSNYQFTRDSIPSILNDRLIEHSGEFIPNVSRPFLRENLHFDRFLAKKYEVRAYQSDWILFKSAEYPAVSAETYDVNDLEALHSLDLSWRARLRQILTIYLRSDQFWWPIASKFLPPRLVVLQRVGPLALAKIWPSRILNDYRAATKDTLFLAHLLTPHNPHIYKPDGTLRKPEEWRDHVLNLYDDTESPLFQKRYEQYGEQMQFLNRQLADFLDRLQATGQFESSTVILHGDHGSRLRLLKSAEREDRRKLIQTTADPDLRYSRYDYVSEPWERDLLDRYATFLAIKLPGAAAPEIVPEKGSVLHFLRRDARISDRNPDEPGINSVYLFDEGGRPREIPILKYWQSAR